MKETRVSVFEDNRNLREGLFNLLESTEGFTCAGAFAHCERVLDNIDETHPDVILMDIELPVVSGIEAVKLIRKKYPDIKILMETIFEEDEKIFQSICSGAQGYILKNTPPEGIIRAIQEIFEGGAPMTPTIASRVLRLFKSNLSDNSDDEYSLSLREKEILKCLVEGMSYKMIADTCFISSDTVNGHIKNIYKKLQVHSKSEAVVKALKGKIV
jgi:DNA-binding NarL/FixJ family response regulator